MSEQASKPMDHLYDGIQEYDNPLPGWWTWIFVGSIFFSLRYLAVTVASCSLASLSNNSLSLSYDSCFRSFFSNSRRR